MLFCIRVDPNMQRWQRKITACRANSWFSCHVMAGKPLEMWVCGSSYVQGVPWLAKRLTFTWYGVCHMLSLLFDLLFLQCCCNVVANPVWLGHNGLNSLWHSCNIWRLTDFPNSKPILEQCWFLWSSFSKMLIKNECAFNKSVFQSRLFCKAVMCSTEILHNPV